MCECPGVPLLRRTRLCAIAAIEEDEFNPAPFARKFHPQYFRRLGDKGLLIRAGRGRYKLYHPLFAGKLKEPYATLVLFLAATGLRIGEALAMKWTDFRDNVLHVTRRIYGGDVDAVKSKRSECKMPIDPILTARMEKLGKGEWVFRSKTGGPLNPGNALKRHVRPAAEKLGISLGGWHDFRHTLSTKLRRSGVHPKVVSDILGRKRVNLAIDTYDRTDVEDFMQPLSLVVNELCPSCSPAGTTAMNQH
jgi:integrase